MTVINPGLMTLINDTPGAVCCLAPFCTAYILIAPTGTSPMGMNLDVGSVDHQPLKVRVIDDPVQQLLPNAAVPPATKAAMGVLPVPIVRRQVPPRCPSPQIPKHRVQKQPVVLGRPPSFPCAARQMRSQKFPNLVRNIVTPMRRCHTSTPHAHILSRNLPSSCYFDDTP